VPRLSVNINKIATLRNTRGSEIPSIVRLAAHALDAGANGITIHPRPDQRHIRPKDVDALAELLKSYPTAEYCIGGNPFHGLLEHCIGLGHRAALREQFRAGRDGRRGGARHGYSGAGAEPANRAATSRRS